MHARIAGTGDAPVGIETERPAPPVGQDGTGTAEERDQRHVIVRLEIGLDDLLGIGRPPSTRVARHDRNGSEDGSTVRLFDDVDDPAKVHLVELAPGESGRPAQGHKGPELVLVAEGLVLVDLGESSPVLRSGDALSATDVTVREWTNLSVGPSRLFWVAT